MDSRFARYSTSFLMLVVMPFLGICQQQQTTYTVQDCIEIALKNNVDARNSDLDVENARLNYLNSFGQKIPTLNLNGSQTRNSGYTINPYTNQFVNQTVNSNQFSLQSGLTLFAGNSINNTHLRLQSAYQASKYTNKVTDNQITLEVAQYYTALLSAYKVEASAKTRLDKVIKDRDRILRRIEAQAASKSELSSADAQVATEQLNVSTATGNITRQKLLLAQRMLIQDINIQVAIPNVDILLQAPADTDIQTVYQVALANLPDAKLARQNVQTNRFAERFAKGGYYPTITANATVTTGYSSGRTRLVTQQGASPPPIYLRDTSGRVITIPGSIIQSTTQVTSVESYPFRNQLNDNINKGLTVQASIPILNRLTTKNNVDNAHILRLKAENETQRVNQTIYNNVASAITEYKIARANLQAAERQQTSLQVALQTAQTRFEAGAGSNFDLLAQQQLFAASQSTFLQQQFEVVFRKLVIDYYMGQPIRL